MADSGTCPLFLDLVVEKTVAHRFGLSVGEHSMGRSNECAVRLIDSTVSGLHASIEVIENPHSISYYEILLSDHGSTNGTWVNGTRLASQDTVQIKVGDQIRCGDVQLMLCGWDGADATRTALAFGSDDTLPHGS